MTFLLGKFLGPEILESGDALASFAKLHKHMVMEQISNITNAKSLDAVFSALADPTRRAILARLAQEGETSVNDLAEPFEMSQPAVSKHLKVLEKAGLIARNIDKQRRPARLQGDALQAAVAWLEELTELWAVKFDQLDAVLKELKSNHSSGDIND